MRRGEHFAACPSAFGGDGQCRGCVPREAVGDSLICGKCFGRVRGLIAGAPEMLAHLRSLGDPLKAAVYDREPGGGAKLHAPPPIPVELLDAPDYIVTVLWSTREVMEGRTPQGRMVVPVGAGATVLFDFATDAVRDILAGLSALSGRHEIVALAEAVIGRPASKDEWTLRTIFERWSLREDPWWAAQPCPQVCTCRSPFAPCASVSCGVRAVKVTPPELPGDETRYECAKCGWQAPDDVDGFWADAFSRREGRAA